MSGARRKGGSVVARLAMGTGAILTAFAPVARAQMAAPVPTPAAAVPAAAPPSAVPAPVETSADTPSFLELAERLRSVGSYSECAVEALRYAYDHPADRERGFDRAALCLSLAGRPEDARRLMLALPSEGTPLGGLGRLRICLTEVFLPELDAPACPALERAAPRGRLDDLARYTARMRAIHARRWADARKPIADLDPPAAVSDPALSVWQARDLDLVARHDALPSKSPWLAGALSAVVPGLGRVYLGRWPDGLISFLLIGLTAGLAAQGFHDEGRDSVRGWILGGFGALLYTGNVYGSAIGAVVQRRDAENAFMQEVDRAYQQRLDP